MPGATPAIQLKPHVIIGGSSSRTTGAEKFANEIQEVQGGGFLVEGLHSGVKDNVLVPSIPGKPVLVSGVLRGLVEVLSSGAITTSKELSSMRAVGDGILALP